MYIVLLRTMIHRGVEYDELTTLKMQFPFSIYLHIENISHILSQIYSIKSNNHDPLDTVPISTKGGGG